MSTADLSLEEARRIALAAQGVDRPRPKGPVTADQLSRTIRRLGLLQIDFVNVLVPAHYLVPFSRLGAYRRALLDEVVYKRGAFTEQWAHEASIVPIETWPLLRHRMETFRLRPWGFGAYIEKHPEYAARILEEIRRRGPLTADDLPPLEGHENRLKGAWLGTIPRAMLEAHFARGLLGVAERRPNYARAFDLADRLIPAEHLEHRPESFDAQRALLLMSARAHGVGTAADLADYYRMNIREARVRIAELVASKQLDQVRVEGWRDPAYLLPGTRTPRRMEASTLLSPFDPIVWCRPRASRLFGFDYRIEIYTPKEKRQWGYYVLPFLLGDRIVARIDLKADRPSRRLVVAAAHLEPPAVAGEVAEALVVELRTMAAWLGLETIAVERRGGLARALLKSLGKSVKA
jgi:uncharacterized protein YcaQ